ncbi:MAG: RDD family protein [Chloroflexi bacterium]|uniref:RDD family protein n=1 Tax=Candidatus Chlorohelix allophototropha TaxID=3003348 RepID=A0A8T7LWB6_9CHLR|nr:RDD family protein [Chloroflexota bacterium]WJW67046.1 RDD family protein [Chloroflexota bacterium L227-S17]
MFCIKCGKENKEGSKVCYYCGALLVNQKPPEQTSTEIDVNQVSSDETISTNCYKCGKENKEGSKVCYYCGALLVKPKPPEVEKVETPPVQYPTATPVIPPTSNNAPGNFPPYYNPTSGGYSPPPSQRSPYPPGYRSPYGMPPSAWRGGMAQPRFPIAPNGVPYVVNENPQAFHSYTKEGKQVYAIFASFSIRVFAAFIDTMIMSIPGFMLSLLVYWVTLPASVLESNSIDPTNPDVVSASNWLILLNGTIYLLYCVFMTARFGQTVGHRLMGLKVMKLDGSKPDLSTALVRNLFGYSWIISQILSAVDIGLVNILGFILTVMVMIGFGSVAWAPRRQGWHDRLAGTIVVHRAELVKDLNF